MSLSFNFSDKLNLLNFTLQFFKKNLLVIMGLGLIAAFGRVGQLGGFGHIATWTNILLEIVIETSRLLLFLYVLGFANVNNGYLLIKRFFTNKYTRKASFITAIQKLRMQWWSFAVNIIGFLIIAWIINYFIDLVAYETCLYLTLKKEGILTESSSEWTILLFFKNLTVIPFTLIFDAILLIGLSTGLWKGTESDHKNTHRLTT
jgi:large-conductance mechanosensitive channel